MRRCLVFGGAGFVGSHLCEKLINDGDFVICVDNLQTSSIENISSIINNKNFIFLELDVVGFIQNKISLYLDKVDEIYNLACPASPIHYQKDPIKTTMTSVVGAYNALNIALERKCPILQCSTSEVYGNPSMHPQNESYFGNVNPCGIRSCYDEGKRCAESLFFDYYRQYGVAIRVIRIFNTYGPRMAKNDGRVVSNFILQALRGEDITIYGDGSQTRSFQYVSDLIDGMIKMMRNDKGFIGPVNIGNPQEYTMNELANLIIRLTKSKSKIIYHELPSDDPTRRRPDISLAKEMLNWSPIVDVKDGLLETIKYFKSKID